MLTWQNILVSPDTSIQEVIGIINRESSRIVLVVDSQRRLLGTVTDGDIRRGLIRHIPLDGMVKEVMNTAPKTASIKNPKEKLMSIMNEFDILQIPIIDNGVVVGLETIQHLRSKNHYDNPVFLMAGGFGKRLYPLTKNCPKPMLKIDGKPILEKIFEGFIASGFHQFYVSTHFMPEIINEYFGDGSQWGVSIKYVYEEKPLGTAGALGLLPDNLPDLPLIMINGDILTKLNAEDLLAFHQKGKCPVTTCVRKYEISVPYGVIESDGDCIAHIHEKPTYKYFVNAGIYVLDKYTRNMIVKNEYMDMPTLIQLLITQGKKVKLFPIHEYWLDVGRVSDFDQAQRDFVFNE